MKKEEASLSASKPAAKKAKTLGEGKSSSGEKKKCC